MHFNTKQGDDNSAFGDEALGSKNTTGSFSNTAIGRSTLDSNNTGRSNTAIGDEALASNTSGIYNTAIGVQALYSNNGGYNTATGFRRS